MLTADWFLRLLPCLDYFWFIDQEFTTSFHLTSEFLLEKIVHGSSSFFHSMCYLRSDLFISHFTLKFCNSVHFKQ